MPKDYNILGYVTVCSNWWQRSHPDDKSENPRDRNIDQALRGRVCVLRCHPVRTCMKQK